MGNDSRSSFEWRDEYSIGIVDIDLQHRRLLVLLKELNDHELRASRRDGRIDHLMDLLEQLNEYAAYHFLSEETLMREHLGKAEFTGKHIAAHRSYWMIIAEFKKRHQAGDAGVGRELLDYLNRWWIKHILETDRKMGQELNRLGVN